MICVIRCVGLADGRPSSVEGQWLKRYDPEAFDGRGDARFTDDIRKAIKFSDNAKAWEFWAQQSKRRPYRPDGQPNKPLTAFSVMIEPLPN